MRDVVLGKFFAMAALFAIPTAVSALYPILLSMVGEFSLASSYAALLGHLLLGLSLIALCTLLSSLVENQIVAALLSVLSALVVAFIDILGSLIPTSSLSSFILCLVAALGVAALMWVSTKNLMLGMIVAVILVLPISLTYIINSALFASLVPDFLTSLNLFVRLGGFTYGHFDIPATVFYMTVIGFFLFLTVQSAEKRRRA
jgi:ABC-2 type transport system permease protein